MEKMNVRIYRKSDEVSVPCYETRGAVGFDLSCSEEVVVPARGHAFMKTGVVVEVPQRYGLFLFARSSTGRKTGLMPFNNVGVIDQDYCGIDDELLVCWYNTSDEDVTISVGDRLAQGVFLRVGIAEFNEVKSDSLESENRGGFGSTDL